MIEEIKWGQELWTRGQAELLEEFNIYLLFSCLSQSESLILFEHCQAFSVLRRNKDKSWLTLEVILSYANFFIPLGKELHFCCLQTNPDIYPDRLGNSITSEVDCVERVSETFHSYFKRHELLAQWHYRTLGKPCDYYTKPTTFWQW